MPKRSSTRATDEHPALLMSFVAPPVAEPAVIFAKIPAMTLGRIAPVAIGIADGARMGSGDQRRITAFRPCAARVGITIAAVACGVAMNMHASPRIAARRRASGVGRPCRHDRRKADNEKRKTPRGARSEHGKVPTPAAVLRSGDLCETRIADAGGKNNGADARVPEISAPGTARRIWWAWPRLPGC